MALIKCPDCGTDVSDAAPACPKCGRPIAREAAQVVAASDSDAAKPRRRAPATFTITLSTFVLIALAILTAVWFVPPLEIGQNLQASCQVNGGGEGQCQFTNTGWTPGAQCIDVSLRNPQGGTVRSEPVCSGRVWPNDTAQKNLMMVIGHTCDGPLGFPDLSKVCTMDIRNVDSGDADAGPPGSSNAPQPGGAAIAGAASVGGGDQAVAAPDAASTSPAAATASTTATIVPDPGSLPVSSSSAPQTAAATPSEQSSSPAPPSSIAALPAGGASVSPVLQAVIAKTAGPSFDCTKATSATALAICGNADLSELDRQMAILYYSRTDYAADQSVRDTQRAWIRGRDTCQADVACLRAEYSARIQQLQQSAPTPTT